MSTDPLPTSVPRVSGSKSTLIALIVVVLGTIAIIGAAIYFTTGGNDSQPASSEGLGMEPNLPVENVAKRPECPAGDDPEALAAKAELNPESPLAKVSLPCLGAPEQGDINLGEALAGKPAVINVWSWNCAPCREEIPFLQQWAKDNPDVHVVGVQAATSEGRGAAFLQEIDTDFVSYQDSLDTVGPALELPRVVPVTVVVRPDGTVAKVFPQAFTTVEEFDSAVRGALGDA
ncbi:TlpA family protein disulfide reductase [Corynebacterium sp. H78]|uniref:TlpA family protein disulfide reductase n=1 Tax=Corynebacterium sp. H78 TaxID=3133417 RepID=UPI0030A17D81